MDRTMLQHLAMVERQIAEQREIVAELARQLLQQLEHLQTMQIADRDRLRKELGL